MGKRKKQAAPKIKETPAALPSHAYGTFHEAWANVRELRKYAQQDGTVRTGLSHEDRSKAMQLIEEYRNG